MLNDHDSFTVALGLTAQELLILIPDESQELIKLLPSILGEDPSYEWQLSGAIVYAWKHINMPVSDPDDIDSLRYYLSIALSIHFDKELQTKLIVAPFPKLILSSSRNHTDSLLDFRSECIERLRALSTHTQFPNIMFPDQDARLKVRHIAVYLALLSFCWGRLTCYPSHETICKKLNIKNRTTVIDILADLQEWGYLVDVVDRHAKNLSNIYTLKYISQDYRKNHTKKVRKNRSKSLGN